MIKRVRGPVFWTHQYRGGVAASTVGLARAEPRTECLTGSRARRAQPPAHRGPSRQGVAGAGCTFHYYPPGGPSSSARGSFRVFRKAHGRDGGRSAPARGETSIPPARRAGPAGGSGPGRYVRICSAVPATGRGAGQSRTTLPHCPPANPGRRIDACSIDRPARQPGE